MQLISDFIYTHAHTHTHPFNGPFAGTTRVSRYQKGKPNLDFTEARDSEWQWRQLGHTQVCTSIQTDIYTTHTHTHTHPFIYIHIYNTHNVIMKTGIMHKNQLAETDLLRAVPLQFAKELHINFILHV